MYLCSQGKKSVMAQSISDWGMVNIVRFFNIYICEKNIKPWMSPSMNHFRGGIKWATLQVSHRCLSQDSLAFAALRHEAPRILRWVLLPSAAKKKGLHFSRLHLTLTCHVILTFRGDKILPKKF